MIGFDHVTNCSSYPNAPQKNDILFLKRAKLNLAQITLESREIKIVPKQTDNTGNTLMFC